MSTTRILIAGDLHLGRTSSRVPGDPDRHRIGTGHAWESIVQCAIDRSVEFVLLSGDIADEDNRFWEAIGPLEHGIGRLAGEGIRTIAVAGNHDHDVLPRLAAAVNRPDAFRLLGRGGQWESWTARRDGDAIFHVVGWSFPGAFAEESPLADMPSMPAENDAPVLGLVHGDLDQRASRYAPLARAALERVPVAGWILGHVHAPMLTDGRPWILYPGSPQALDFGEPGRHGVWLLEIEDGVVRPPRPIGLSTVRYEPLAIDVTGADDREALDRLLARTINACAEACIDESGAALEHVVLRVGLGGRSALHEQLAHEAERLAQDLRFTLGSTRIAVQRIENRVLPAIDLESFARGPTVVNELSRLLLDLECAEPSPATVAVLDRARDAMAAERERSDYLGLTVGAGPPDPAAVREVVVDEARRLLGALLEQDE